MLQVGENDMKGCSDSMNCLLHLFTTLDIYRNPCGTSSGDFPVKNVRDSFVIILLKFFFMPIKLKLLLLNKV